MPVIYTLSRKAVGGFAEVHIRFYNGRACDLRARTRIYVPVLYWNAQEGRCSISRRYENADIIKAKDAQRQLDDLTARVVDAYAAAGGTVNREWLQRIIDGSLDEKPLVEIIDTYCDTSYTPCVCISSALRT